ncbi:MAG: DNA/RNA non-specific endonuclease [Patescibacteria group bacterium]
MEIKSSAVFADELQLKEAPRDYHRGNTPDKLPDDHAGHIIADLFGGSGNYDNLVSMNKDVNLRSYRVLERDWANLIKAKSKVKVQIDCIYKGSSARPSAFDIKYWVDGGREVKKINENN